MDDSKHIPVAQVAGNQCLEPARHRGNDKVHCMANISEVTHSNISFGKHSSHAHWVGQPRKHKH